MSSPIDPTATSSARCAGGHGELNSWREEIKCTCGRVYTRYRAGLGPIFVQRACPTCGVVAP